MSHIPQQTNNHYNCFNWRLVKWGEKCWYYKPTIPQENKKYSPTWFELTYLSHPNYKKKMFELESVNPPSSKHECTEMESKALQSHVKGHWNITAILPIIVMHQFRNKNFLFFLYRQKRHQANWETCGSCSRYYIEKLHALVISNNLINNNFLLDFPPVKKCSLFDTDEDLSD